jgi:hypothetical protein
VTKDVKCFQTKVSENKNQVKQPKSIKDHILKICPHWDALGAILIDKPSLQPKVTSEENISNAKDEVKTHPPLPKDNSTDDRSHSTKNYGMLYLTICQGYHRCWYIHWVNGDNNREMNSECSMG